MFQFIISKIHRFKDVVSKSLFDLSFYQSLQNKPLRFSFRYLFFLLLFIIFILIFSVILPFFIFGKIIPQYSNRGFQYMKEIFPEGLTLTLKDGSLRTNVDEPFYIEMPKQFSNLSNKTHLVVIDTKNKYSNISDYNSWIVVGKNNIYIMEGSNNSDERYETFSLKETRGYFVINKEVYLRILDSLKPYLSYAGFFYYSGLCIVLFVFPFIGAAVYFVCLIMYISLYSYFLYLLFNLLHISNVTFKSIFHISLHVITVPLTFQFVQYLYKISVPFTFTFPFLIWMIYILIYLSKDVHANHKIKPSD